jgi:hypothetical protein
MNRTGLTFEQIRSFWEIEELTGRAKSSEIPEAIAALEVTYPKAGEKSPVDICLASNILEVGIDIDRLSLIAVVGQPKTTSQYIQVTGRVGRRWWERPGLVITIYGASKPRDRSHFEQFRSYHERLYAQVEPTSVTPFSPPALDRALHAVIAAYTRQAGDWTTAKYPLPFPGEILEHLRSLLLKRIQAIDPEEQVNFERVFEKRMAEWQLWQRTKWSDWSTPEGVLLRQAGSYASQEVADLSWETPTSMRSVDAECEAAITTLYIR